MNDTDSLERDEAELLAPQRLTDDLSALYRVDLAVPTEIDDAVRAMSRRHFAARTRVRYVGRWLAAAAVAAVVLVVFWAATMRGRPREDIDGSGRVDILDAFALARAIDQKTPTKRQWDVNADGAVNRADVDAIALAAVRLDKGRVQ